MTLENMHPQVALAKRIATEAHEGQTRWNGDSYITHPERVAERVKNHSYRVVAAAYLHDVIEDTSTTEEDLKKLEVESLIIQAVVFLTKRENIRYDQYLANIMKEMHDPARIIAREVKQADLCDNMSDLKEGQRKDKYRLAYMVLNYGLPYVEK